MENTNNRIHCFVFTTGKIRFSQQKYITMVDLALTVLGHVQCKILTEVLRKINRF
jgi:hypothetical protein